MAIFQFAFVIQTQIGITNAVREAARRAAAADGPTSVWVAEQLCGTDLAACDGGLLAENVQGFSGARLAATPMNVGGISYPSNPGIQCSAYDVNGVTNYRITVAVSYKNPVFFPLLAYATDLVDGTPDGSWTLGSSAEMRLEHDLSGGTC
jgi:hypothetical protein